MKNIQSSRSAGRHIFTAVGSQSWAAETETREKEKKYNASSSEAALRELRIKKADYLTYYR